MLNEITLCVTVLLLKIYTLFYGDVARIINAAETQRMLKRLHSLRKQLRKTHKLRLEWSRSSSISSDAGINDSPLPDHVSAKVRATTAANMRNENRTGSC